MILELFYVATVCCDDLWGMRSDLFISSWMQYSVAMLIKFGFNVVLGMMLVGYVWASIAVLRLDVATPVAMVTATVYRPAAYNPL